MCEPITISAGVAYTSMALAAAGAAVAANAQIQAGKARSRAAQRNALLARRRISDAHARAGAAESRLNLRTSQLMGRQRAAAGASGAVADSGATLTMLEDTAMIAELDTLTIRNNAAREAYGAEIDASNALFSGRLARFEGNMGAAGSLLTGASQVFGMHSNFKTTGAI